MARNTASMPAAWNPTEILGPGWTAHRNPRPRLLESSYTVFGLARRADTSLLLCEAALGFPLPDYSERRRLFGTIVDGVGARPTIVVFTDAAHSAFVWSWIADTYVGGGRRVEYRAPERTASLTRAIARPSRSCGKGSGDVAARDSVAGLLCARLGGPSSAGGLPALLEEIAALDDVDRIRNVWRRLDALTVLDPDCGTGEWLLGAAEALSAVSVVCLDRIRAYVDDAGASRIARRPEHLRDLRSLVRVSEDARQHRSPEEFVRRRTIQRNLFGVAMTAHERTATEQRLARYAGRSRDGMGILDSNVALLRETSGSADRAATTRMRPKPTNEPALVVLEEEWEVLSRTASMLREQRLDAVSPPRDLKAAAERLSLRRRTLLQRMDAERGAGGAPLNRAVLLDAAFLRGIGSPAFHLQRCAQ